jgi:hypothetical protein
MSEIEELLKHAGAYCMEGLHEKEAWISTYDWTCFWVRLTG